MTELFKRNNTFTILIIPQIINLYLKGLFRVLFIFQPSSGFEPELMVYKTIVIPLYYDGILRDCSKLDGAHILEVPVPKTLS